MANRFQIRHGSTKPGTGDSGLRPFELGFDKKAGILYINSGPDDNGNELIEQLAKTGTLDYLPLGGGTLEDYAQITRIGKSQQWINGRDGAIVRMDQINGYSPCISIKTTNGSWEIGACDYDSTTNDKLYFTYAPDSNYNAGSNRALNFYITPEGATSLSPVGYLPLTGGTLTGVLKFPSSMDRNTSPTVVATYINNNSSNGLGYAQCADLSVGSATNATNATNANYASSSGNADTVDSQHFYYSNESNGPTYLWATNSNGSNWLARRDSISVNYASSSGNADTVDNIHFHWNGKTGQPTWVWGGFDSDWTNQYVYNPSNFSVNYANSSGYAASAGAAPASNIGYKVASVGFSGSDGTMSADGVTTGSTIIAMRKEGQGGSYGINSLSGATCYSNGTIWLTQDGNFGGTWTISAIWSK